MQIIRFSKNQKKLKMNNKVKGIIISLGVLVLLAIAYGYTKSKEYKKLETILVNEKQDLQNELDEIVLDYNEAIADKTALSGRLELELNKIMELRDSVKALKVANYGLLRRLRKKIANLERQNRILFVKVDSLSNVNSDLTEENITVKEELTENKEINKDLIRKNDSIERVNKELAARVAKGNTVKMKINSVTTLKQKSSGRLTTTSRSSRTDAFRLNFDLLENPIPKAGKKKIYIQIIDENGNIINQKGMMKAKDGTQKPYSDIQTVDYNNKTIRLTPLMRVNRDDFSRGLYVFNFYLDGEFAGASSVELR